MQGKHWLVVVAMLAVTGFGCREPNPYHCPGGSECPPVGGPCSSSGECRAPTPVCNADAMTCVECLENTDCSSGRPVCNDQNTCVQCQTDDDCESKLCLTGGTCVAPGEVTYVGGDNTSDTSMCTIDMPCRTLAQGLVATTALRKYMKLTGAVMDAAATTISKTVIIHGRAGAQISRPALGEVLLIKGMMSPSVTLVDLEIVGNSDDTKECVKITEKPVITMERVRVRNHAGPAITLANTAKLTMIESHVHDNGKEGVSAAYGTTLELRRSMIYKNSGIAGVSATSAAMVTIESSTIASNTGSAGGVSITGPFSIRNSIIAGNGNVATTTSAGGLTLNPLVAENAKFEFNTVADNSSSSTTNGLNCSNVSFAVSNSIFINNNVSNCTVTYSLMDAASVPVEPNKAGNPMFVTKALLDPMFYRIGPTSAAINSADPAATLDVDIDGQARNDARKDMGADEFN